MSGLNLSEIELFSVNASWYNANHRKCSIDDFKVALKAAHLSYESACTLFGSSSKPALTAKKKVQYLMNQIDKDKSDIFALLMFNTSEWDF